jgi:hypothetical protein
VIVGGTVLFDASDLVSSTTSRPRTRWTVCATVRVSADAACGFAVEGVLRGEFRLDGRYLDDILMARALGRSEQLR